MVVGEPTATGFDRAYRRLGERQARSLLEDVRRSPERAVAAGERTAAFVVACLVHLLTVALIVGGVVLVVVTWFDWVALVGGVLLTTAGLAVLPRLERPPPGQRLRTEEVPLLVDLCDEIADSLAAPRAEVVIVDDGFNVGYTASGLTQRRVLVLGLPFWAILDGGERVAVLGHEFGHAVSGDPSTSVVIGGALQTLARWQTMLRPDRSRYTQAWARGFLIVVDPLLYVASLPLRGAEALLAHLVLRDQQRCEYLADVYAAGVAGSDAAGRALEKTLLLGAVDDELARLGSVVAMRDVWSAVRDRADRELSSRRGELLYQAASEQASLDATHPPTTLRLELLASLAVAEPCVRRRPAEWVAIDAELSPLAGPLGRGLVNRYRG